MLDLKKHPIWWACKEGHEWKSSIEDRADGKECPECAGISSWKPYNDELKKIFRSSLNSYDGDKQNVQNINRVFEQGEKIYQFRNGHSKRFNKVKHGLQSKTITGTLDAVEELESLGIQLFGRVARMLEAQASYNLHIYETNSEHFETIKENGLSIMQFYCYLVEFNQIDELNKDFLNSLLKYFRDSFVKIIEERERYKAGEINYGKILNLNERKKTSKEYGGGDFPHYLDDVTDYILDKNYNLAEACKNLHLKNEQSHAEKYIMAQFKNFSETCLDNWLLRKNDEYEGLFKVDHINDIQKAALEKYFKYTINPEGRLTLKKSD